MVVEVVSLKTMSLEARAELVRQLGYQVQGRAVLKDGAPLLDPYIAKPVTLENMGVLPGSAILIVDNAVSLAAYFEEHGDWG